MAGACFNDTLVGVGECDDQAAVILLVNGATGLFVGALFVRLSPPAPSPPSPFLRLSPPQPRIFITLHSWYWSVFHGQTSLRFICKAILN